MWPKQDVNVTLSDFLLQLKFQISLGYGCLGLGTTTHEIAHALVEFYFLTAFDDHLIFMLLSYPKPL